ncbi:DinB family protein [Alkalihalobacillus oceani]|uniref:DinB family protein n=1 Tax=Halalkalibacter oceani TaxID=1653776 RepID=UPI00203A8882|nr:DinB family protein [Halalkalibacter oceani]MCM3762513.1 DinB family protein [Halalkalibacter oceani]
MSDRFTLHLFADIRSQLLEAVSGLTDSQWDVVPAGFTNNLHWQVGHVLTITDELLFTISGVGSRIPTEDKTFFSAGTSPADWSESPPAPAMIIKQLDRQAREICDTFSGKFMQPVEDVNNFIQAEVIGELFDLLLAH